MPCQSEGGRMEWVSWAGSSHPHPPSPGCFRSPPRHGRRLQASLPAQEQDPGPEQDSEPAPRTGTVPLTGEGRAGARVKRQPTLPHRVTRLRIVQPLEPGAARCKL